MSDIGTSLISPSTGVMEKDENGETMVETIKDSVATSAYRYSKVRKID